jgi:hypothetical protein
MFWNHPDLHLGGAHDPLEGAVDQGWEAKGLSHIMALTGDGLNPQGPNILAVSAQESPEGTLSRHTVSKRRPI